MKRKPTDRALPPAPSTKIEVVPCSKPGAWRVVLQSVAGSLVVGQRLVKGLHTHPRLDAITSTPPTNLPRATAEILAADWRCYLAAQEANEK